MEYPATYAYPKIVPKTQKSILYSNFTYPKLHMDITIVCIPLRNQDANYHIFSSIYTQYHLTQLIHIIK